VIVDVPDPTTPAVEFPDPDNETTLESDDEYDHDPAMEGETVGAVSVNEESP